MQILSPIVLTALTTGLFVSCGGGTPEHVNGGTTVRTNVGSKASADVTESEIAAVDDAPRGRSFDDTSPMDDTASTAEAALAGASPEANTETNPVDSSQFGSPGSGLNGDPTAAFNNVAPALRADPGKTAAGSIEGLVTFGDLSLVGVDIDALLDYLYKPDTDKAKAFEFPDKVKEKAGEGKALVGYMIPLEYKPKSDDIIIFMLVRDLSTCCFGGVPRPDEWIYIEMRDDNVAQLFPYVPVVVRGELIVGRLEDEFGFATGVYTVHADSVEAFQPPEPAKR